MAIVQASVTHTCATHGVKVQIGSVCVLCQARSGDDFFLVAGDSCYHFIALKSGRYVFLMGVDPASVFVEEKVGFQKSWSSFEKVATATAGQGWVTVEDEDTEEILPPITYRQESKKPECSCLFSPDPNCVIDHMGKRKLDPICTCKKGEINGTCQEHGSPDYRS